MSKADAALDRASDRLRDLSESMEERGGPTGKLAEPLAEDADFVRKLKPSLVKERLREDPTGSGPAADPPSSPRGRPSSRGRERSFGGKRRNVEQTSAKRTLPLVGGAFAGGFLLAKIVDWRGHAHPRG